MPEAPEPPAPPADEEEPLAARLAGLELGADVPAPLRQAVGAALAWLDQLGREAAGGSR